MPVCGAVLQHAAPAIDDGQHRRHAWWAPIGGLAGALQVYMGLTQVNKVGAEAVLACTVTASLLIDHYGFFRMDVHPLNWLHGRGALLLVGGVALIAKF